MESVEELCEHIALLDKANKVLEGKLVDIKNQFKTNTYEVGLSIENKSKLLKDLKARFVITPANFKSLEDDLKLNVKLQSNESSTDLIKYLNTKADINHYVEVIPSVSDIFIQAVNQNE